MNITEMQERIEKLEKELIAIKNQHHACYQPCWHGNVYPYNPYYQQGYPTLQYYSQMQQMQGTQQWDITTVQSTGGTGGNGNFYYN